jgi:hypothetical protein
MRGRGDSSLSDGLGAGELEVEGNRSEDGEYVLPPSESDEYILPLSLLISDFTAASF